MALRRSLARWHIWLGWLIGVPLILWTASGLWMVARPIEEVRGEAIRREPVALPVGFAPVLPRLGLAGAHRVEMTMRADRAVWIIHGEKGIVGVADAATGAILPDVDAVLARRIADAALVKPAPVVAVERFAADANPLELRRERPAWRVRYADGVNLYVDAQSGAVLAVRTRQWRLFDLAWGLHIMDLQEREDTSHPLLILFAALALIGSLIGMWLLFLRQHAQRKRRATGKFG